MGLLVEGISVVTKKTIIEEKYRGGFSQYAEDCPNYTFCADEHLTGIMFQTLDDAYRWVRRLEIMKNHEKSMKNNRPYPAKRPE